MLNFYVLSVCGALNFRTSKQVDDFKEGIRSGGRGGGAYKNCLLNLRTMSMKIIA